MFSAATRNSEANGRSGYAQLSMHVRKYRLLRQQSVRGVRPGIGFLPCVPQYRGLLVDDAGHYTCGNPACGAALAKCQNYAEHNACNRCITTDTAETLCDCCRFNATIPDLSVAGNWEKWRRLESAKRRLFYDLDELGLPYGKATDQVNPPLTFDFKADVIPNKNFWRLDGARQSREGLYRACGRPDHDQYQRGRRRRA